MPHFYLGGKNTPIYYASEHETLEFANAVREAGGGDVIPALLPGSTGNARSCLIANSLNFECSIGPADGYARPENGEFLSWTMALSNAEVGEKIAKALRLFGRDPFGTGTEYEIILPKHIGNAAHAFDADFSGGWTSSYRVPRQW